MRFPQRREPEEIILLASMYHDDLVDNAVGEIEFSLLKKEIDYTSRFFPSIAEILEKRYIFYGEGGYWSHKALKLITDDYEDSVYVVGTPKQINWEKEHRGNPLNFLEEDIERIVSGWNENGTDLQRLPQTSS